MLLSIADANFSNEANRPRQAVAANENIGGYRRRRIAWRGKSRDTERVERRAWHLHPDDVSSRCGYVAVREREEIGGLFAKRGLDCRTATVTRSRCRPTRRVPCRQSDRDEQDRGCGQLRHAHPVPARPRDRMYLGEQTIAHVRRCTKRF